MWAGGGPEIECTGILLGDCNSSEGQKSSSCRGKRKGVEERVIFMILIVTFRR